MKIKEIQKLALMLSATPAQGFKPGDVVVWKDPALRYASTPEDTQPVVISKVLSTPVVSPEEDIDSAEFGMTFDVGVLLKHNSRDIYMEHLFDSRRLRHATQEEIDAWDAGEEERAAAAANEPQAQCDCPRCQLVRSGPDALLRVLAGAKLMTMPLTQPETPAADETKH